MKEYEVLLNDRLMGKAKVTDDGLYTKFTCMCHFETMGTYRIKVTYKDREVDLGICIPEGEFFVINTKIASKYLGAGEPMFYVVNTQENKENFAPIRNDEPFSFISMMDKGRFLVKDTCPGMVFDSIILQEDHPGK